MAEPAPIRQQLSQLQASVPGPAQPAETQTAATKPTRPTENPKKRSFDNEDYHETPEPKRRQGAQKAQTTSKPQSAANVAIVNTTKTNKATKTKANATKTNTTTNTTATTTNLTTTKKVQRRWMSCDVCKARRRRCDHKILREVGSVAPLPAAAPELEHPQTEAQSVNIEPTARKESLRKLAKVHLPLHQSSASSVTLLAMSSRTHSGAMQADRGWSKGHLQLLRRRATRTCKCRISRQSAWLWLKTRANI